MVYEADDNMRAEHIERIRRKVVTDIARGEPAPDHWDAAHPWTACFVLAANAKEYWDEHVKERAVAWHAHGGHGAPQPAIVAFAAQNLPGIRANITPDRDRSKRERSTTPNPQEDSPSASGSARTG